MTKYYKDYEVKLLGSSDIASLILAGADGVSYLDFGSDGSYSAYVVDDNAIIGEHYKLIASFDYWLRVYDDEGLTATFKASKINVYRAGDFGCIIQLIK